MNSQKVGESRRPHLEHLKHFLQHSAVATVGNLLKSNTIGLMIVSWLNRIYCSCTLMAFRSDSLVIVEAVTQFARSLHMYNKLLVSGQGRGVQKATSLADRDIIYPEHSVSYVIWSSRTDNV